MNNLKIIYEDNHIIVVEKIPNIPSQGDKTGDIDMLEIIKKYIKEKRKRKAGPSWIQRKIDSLTKEIFSDDDMK